MQYIQSLLLFILYSTDHTFVSITKSNHKIVLSIFFIMLSNPNVKTKFMRP